MIKERVNWLDTAKGLCMIFVILSHAFHSPKEISVFYRPFFLATFFFVTGYTLKAMFDAQVIKKKAKRLLLPWIIFSTVDIGLVSIFGAERNFIKRFVLNLLQIKGFYDSLWFLPCTFVVSLTVMFLLKKTSFKVTLISMIVLTIINRLYITIIPREFFSWNTLSLPWHIHLIGPVGLIMLFGYYVADRKMNCFFDIKGIGGVATACYLVSVGSLYYFKKCIIEISGGDDRVVYCNIPWSNYICHNCSFLPKY